MNVSGIVSLVRRSAGVALVGAMLSPVAAASAQDELPKIRLSQMVDPRWAWGNEARVRLDRDAFLVVLEFGADRRVRMVYPESPQDSPFTPGETQVYAELPSADAMFIRTMRVEVPTLVAIASDLAPDLSTFTAEGRFWDFDYEIPQGATRIQMIRSLAAIMFGGEGMPYSFEVKDIAPQLSTFALGALNSCGYLFGSQISPGFNNFLWQTFGPLPLHLHELNNGTQWFHGVGGIRSQFGFFPLGFRRYVDNGLWNQFGAGCAPLQRFAYSILPVFPQGPPVDNGDQIALAPLPKDRDPLDRPPVVPDVGILVASPAEQARRGALVTDAADKAVAAKPATPVRTESQDLVQRTQVLEFIRQLSVQQTLGMDRNRVAAESYRPRRVQRSSGGSGSAGGVRRASAGGGSSGVGSSGSVGSSGGSSSGGSVGSGSSSGGGRGGSAGGGRTGSGGRVPPI